MASATAACASATAVTLSHPRLVPENSRQAALAGANWAPQYSPAPISAQFKTRLNDLIRTAPSHNQRLSSRSLAYHYLLRLHHRSPRSGMNHALVAALWSSAEKNGADEVAIEHDLPRQCVFVLDDFRQNDAAVGNDRQHVGDIVEVDGDP